MVANYFILAGVITSIIFLSTALFCRKWIEKTKTGLWIKFSRFALAWTILVFIGILIYTMQI